MLHRLIIQNYAIIEHTEIDFSGRLNVITGETGAGKSILLGALSMILGERADPGVLFKKDSKCVIEGIFKVKKQQVQHFFDQYELDMEDQLIIRREISAAGKSRAFVNDTPVNLGQLNELSRLLVDLHQQFDTLDLGRSDFQREVVDALAAQPEALQQYAQLFARYVAIQKELKELADQRDNSNKEYDYNKFLLDELEEAAFSENELESVDTELKGLSHAEEIKNSLSGCTINLRKMSNRCCRC
ncbi:AAA family ATPase [Chitinophaga sedimenti]|uniref:AAA family ATPase n=1 Tax=Chitinophaga sedimenti TaxID=2033606 RepID=UPI0020066AEF|nr:AAA family ATPase [Chitinophaga sedimenti]MCK7559744.1 AAA family ATPase [Chitinophaga sedimenti]